MMAGTCLSRGIAAATTYGSLPEYPTLESEGGIQGLLSSHGYLNHVTSNLPCTRRGNRGKETEPRGGIWVQLGHYRTSVGRAHLRQHSTLLRAQQRLSRQALAVRKVRPGSARCPGLALGPAQLQPGQLLQPGYYPSQPAVQPCMVSA